MSDPVNHPAHYNQGGIECIDAIEGALADDAFSNLFENEFPTSNKDME